MWYQPINWDSGGEKQYLKYQISILMFLSLCVSVCTFGCMCLFMDLYEYMCMPVLAHVKTIGKCQIVKPFFILFSWGTKTEASHFVLVWARLLAEKPPEILTSSHLEIRLCIWIATPYFLHGCWVSKLRYSHFHSMCSYPLSPQVTRF